MACLLIVSLRRSDPSTFSYRKNFASRIRGNHRTRGRGSSVPVQRPDILGGGRSCMKCTVPPDVDIGLVLVDWMTGASQLYKQANICGRLINHSPS